MLNNKNSNLPVSCRNVFAVLFESFSNVLCYFEFLIWSCALFSRPQILWLLLFFFLLYIHEWAECLQHIWRNHLSLWLLFNDPHASVCLWISASLWDLCCDCSALLIYCERHASQWGHTLAMPITLYTMNNGEFTKWNCWDNNISTNCSLFVLNYVFWFNVILIAFFLYSVPFHGHFFVFYFSCNNPASHYIYFLTDLWNYICILTRIKDWCSI